MIVINKINKHDGERKYGAAAWHIGRDGWGGSTVEGRSGGALETMAAVEVRGGDASVVTATAEGRHK